MTDPDPTTAVTAKRPIPVAAIIAGVLAVALLGTGVAWYLSARAAEDRLAEAESRLDAIEASVTAPVTDPPVTTPTEEPATPPAETPDAPDASKPSYTSFAYVTSVAAQSGSYTLALDLFEILTGNAATTYANEHGMTPPGNGILYVNEDPGVIGVPLSNTAIIQYATGGVEALTMVPTNAEKLREWADGDMDALPGAMTDMWKITVVDGVATRVEMIAVAD